ncbi:HD domain-containing phosphohydrolase [Vogesella oryzae]|uniref:HD domain-containing phosphohydrolase n=1 Tax=Vogesella oryzae TaxID=1735285 RepID=UPI0015824325|nr:HD domain-containing phosphohydrolase [Vogesella oryzae]
MNYAAELLKSLYTMAMVVEARDAYTGGHLWRVSQFSRQLAQAMHLPSEEVARIELGGFLHDLGKVGVPDAILNKRERLSDEEYDIIKTHPRVGADLLAGHPLSSLAYEAVFMHHETPDGRGYPQGLAGDAIPQAARIVGVCDAFDAMTSSRPYRAGMPPERALQIIEDHLGSQFDVTAGRALLALGKGGRLAHIIGHSEAGIPLQHCTMCGPIIAVPRRSGDGATVYCPNCASGYRVARRGRELSLTPSGSRDTVAARQPVPDAELIDELVEAVYRALPAPRRGWLPRLWR